MASAQGKIEELKKKIFFTLLLLFVYRMAAQIPVPGVNGSAIQSYFAESGGGIFDLINTFSGGAFKRFSILALGIMPYITTSIIFSLLGEVIPQLAEICHCCSMLCSGLWNGCSIRILQKSRWSSGNS
jgi:preprotein translocase subunit SecY